MSFHEVNRFESSLGVTNLQSYITSIAVTGDIATPTDNVT